jgi:protoporphyrin/coproporphyrin ferrochelatase
MPENYDALLVVSFGGPDGPEDVIPFLENVLRGRNVPRERMLEVAEHYFHFGGKSPINEQNRSLIAAIERELDEHGPRLPVYFGNRNWHPLLPDTLRQMAADGKRRAIAFVTSAFSSYSSCRQYREDIARAREEVGPHAPEVDKLRVFYNHPGFIETMAEHTREALDTIPADRRERTSLVFTAHSIPAAMAAGSRYEAQLLEASRLVAQRAGHANWQLAYQSRSGPPQQPWLGPDVGDVARALASDDARAELIVVPIGFLSDHMEVIYDLDHELRAICDSLGVTLFRARTAGTHPRFVSMIRELIMERMSAQPERRSLGVLGASADDCPADCCTFTPRG